MPSPHPSSAKNIEKELLETQKELERSRRFFAEFVQKMAHDVQAPAKKIRSFVDLLEMSVTLPENAKEHMRRIETNAIELIQIVQDLKKYAQSEAPSVKKDVD